MSHRDSGRWFVGPVAHFIQNCAFIENERQFPRNNRNAFLEVNFENRVAQTAEALNLWISMKLKKSKASRVLTPKVTPFYPYYLTQDRKPSMTHYPQKYPPWPLDNPPSSGWSPPMIDKSRFPTRNNIQLNLNVSFHIKLQVDLITR